MALQPPPNFRIIWQTGLGTSCEGFAYKDSALELWRDLQDVLPLAIKKANFQERESTSPHGWRNIATLENHVNRR